LIDAPGVETDRSIRFALWNNEETGLNGARAYAEQRKDLQGIESPKGSGKYPEPKWLGMIQHDMMMFDHGMPHEDGTLSKEQRSEADVNIEFQSASKFAEQALKLVAHGGAEATVQNLAVACRIIRMNGLTNLKLAGITHHEFPLRFAVRKDAPELTSILNKGLL